MCSKYGTMFSGLGAYCTTVTVCSAYCTKFTGCSAYNTVFTVCSIYCTMQPGTGRTVPSLLGAVDTVQCLLGAVCTRPPQKIVFSGFMSAPCNHEFFRVIEIYGKHFMSFGQPKVTNQDPPVFTTPLYITQNKTLKTMPTWVVRKAQQFGKRPEAWFQVPAKLCLVSRSK